MASCEQCPVRLSGLLCERPLQRAGTVQEPTERPGRVYSSPTAPREARFLVSNLMLGVCAPDPDVSIRTVDERYTDPPTVECPRNTANEDRI